MTSADRKSEVRVGRFGTDKHPFLVIVSSGPVEEKKAEASAPDLSVARMGRIQTDGYIDVIGRDRKAKKKLSGGKRPDKKQGNSVSGEQSATVFVFPPLSRKRTPGRAA